MKTIAGKSVYSVLFITGDIGMVLHENCAIGEKNWRKYRQYFESEIMLFLAVDLTL